MQGNVLGQSGGGSKINGIIEEYMVASGGNVSAGDFVEYVNQKYTSRVIVDSQYVYSGMGCVSCVKVDTNKVFICYKGTADIGIYGMVCIIENENIRSGVITSVAMGESSYTEILTQPLSVVCLSPNKVLVLYRDDYVRRNYMYNFRNKYLSKNIYSNNYRRKLWEWWYSSS